MKKALFTATVSAAALVGTFAVAISPAFAEDAAVSVSASTTLPLRARVQERIQQVKANAAQNREDRGKTVDERADVRQDRKAEVVDIRASSTAELKDERGDRDARQDTRKQMRADIFGARRDAIVDQLTISLNNLTDIKSRIDTRIAKLKTDGKDVASAERLLITAVADLAEAKTNIDALATVTTPTIDASSTAEVDLTKPRAAADTATKSIRDAREALRQVVEAIAHSMGVTVSASSTTTQ
jgi:hypothetical protein